MKQFTVLGLILSSFLFTALTFPKPKTNLEKLEDNEIITLDNLKSHLNRTANKLTGTKKAEFPLAEKGFTWKSDDSKTKKWRPQGITGVITEKGQQFVIVSWYGRNDGSDYRNRGARVSIVNVTDMDNIQYRHVLLVAKNTGEGNEYLPFYDKGKKDHKGVMHAGGIVALNGKLHVADSRKDHRCIRVFDLNTIIKLPEEKAIHKYSYILAEEYAYKSPIKPSFISYDNDRKKILMGAFNEDPSTEKPNLFTWFTPPASKAEVIDFDKKASDIDVFRLPNKYKKIQGMVAAKEAGKQIFWLSTSFGRDNRSNFYKMNVGDMPTEPNIATVSNSKSYKYPPGLEDAYLSSKNNLWMLTEFAYEEGSYLPLDDKDGFSLNKKDTRRVVFAVAKSNILP